MEPFIHLHVHTQYSLLDGQASIDALIDKAQKDGMNAIAVTDHGNMFGIKEFFNKVSKKNGKPLGAIKDLEKEQKALKGKEGNSEILRDSLCDYADCRSGLKQRVRDDRGSDCSAEGRGKGGLLPGSMSRSCGLYLG